MSDVLKFDQNGRGIQQKCTESGGGADLPDDRMAFDKFNATRIHGRSDAGVPYEDGEANASVRRSL